VTPRGADALQRRGARGRWRERPIAALKNAGLREARKNEREALRREAPPGVPRHEEPHAQQHGLRHFADAVPRQLVESEPRPRLRLLLRKVV
jgi:hypothetical protein